MHKQIRVQSHIINNGIVMFMNMFSHSFGVQYSLKWRYGNGAVWKRQRLSRAARKFSCTFILAVLGKLIYGEYKITKVPKDEQQLFEFNILSTFRRVNRNGVE